MCDSPAPTIWYLGVQLHYLKDYPEKFLDDAQEHIDSLKKRGLKAACIHHGDISHFYQQL